MNAKTRVAFLFGAASILFSTLCIIVMPVFSGAIMLAPLVGLISGTFALVVGANRTAAVTFAFALVPACGLIVMETVSQYVGTGYVAFAPLAAAILLAAWAVANYSHTNRAAHGAAS